MGWTEKWKAIFERSIVPSHDEIAENMLTGRLTVVVHDLDPMFHDAASQLGWDGHGTFFVLSGENLTRFAQQLRKMGDASAADWLVSGRNGRIFLMCDAGTLCINFNDGVWSFEPGTTDTQWMN